MVFCSYVFWFYSETPWPRTTHSCVSLREQHRRLDKVSPPFYSYRYSGGNDLLGVVEALQHSGVGQSVVLDVHEQFLYASFLRLAQRDRTLLFEQAIELFGRQHRCLLY